MCLVWTSRFPSLSLSHPFSEYTCVSSVKLSVLHLLHFLLSGLIFPLLLFVLVWSLRVLSVPCHFHLCFCISLFFFLGFSFVAFSSPTICCLHFEILDTAFVNRACFMFPTCVPHCLHLGPHILRTLTFNVSLSMRMQIGFQFKIQPAIYSVMLSCRSTAGNSFLVCLGPVVAIRPEVCAWIAYT